MVSTGSNSSVISAEAAADRRDVVVAVTSDNDVATIGSVVTAVRDGLTGTAGSRAVQIVLVDAGSTDGTREAARDAAGEALLEVEYDRGALRTAPPYHGQPHRAAGLRAIFETVRRLDASACAVVDARLQTVRADWVERLVGPVLTGEFDYVSAFYHRHAGEGALTKGLVYPTFRALYGARLRQPAASEFGCSGRLAAHCLDEDLWSDDQAAAAIDLRISVAAVCGGFRACEAMLGSRAAAPRAAAADLSTVIAQVVGALFADIEQRVDVWQRVRGSAPVPVFGNPQAADGPPPALNADSLIESFQLGYRELREIWAGVLPPRTIVELRRLTETPRDRFHLDDRLWASIVYDFAAGYAFGVLPHDHLLRSLTPLYSGWLASFLLQVGDAGAGEVEARIETLCATFEAEKRHLISKWRWPERPR
jgi:hypothetical protein